MLQKAQQSAVTLRGKSKIEIVDAEMKKALDERNKTIEALPDPKKDAGKDAAKPADAKPADAKPEDAKPEDKTPEDKKPDEKK